MTKREAKRIAHQIAYTFIQQAIDVGYPEDERDEDGKIAAALDALAQQHYDRGMRSKQ